MTISPKLIVELRKDRGWSQEKLAAIAGLSERTIQRAERDGTCSLDSKMALATAFEVSPSALTHDEQEFIPDDVTYKISWGGVVGLFILGLAMPLLAIVTGQHGMWELVSAMIVIVVTVSLSLVNFGAKSTYRLLDNTSWIVKYPSYVLGLNTMIIQAKAVINHAYLVGLIATLVTALAVAVHAEEKLQDPVDFTLLSIRPLFYAMMFVEFWFRPYKKKMEFMLMQQNLHKGSVEASHVI